MNLKLNETLYRPENDNIYTSENNLFKLHFDNTGSDAVPQNYNFHTSIPDYIILSSQYLEASYFYLHDTLGFAIPPIDDSTDPQIDVYFSNLGNGNYGGTMPENSVTSTLRANDWTSYIQIDNDMIGDLFFTQDTSALKVTCAHELFHVFQLGYNFFGTDVWYLEACAVWFEDKMYPEVNDYLQYADEYKNNWGQQINKQGSPDFYQLYSWNLFLDEKFKDNAENPILDIWENILETNAITSLSTFFMENGITWESALSEWGISQIYCGENNFPEESLFPDAELIPQIRFDNYPNNYSFFNTKKILSQEITNEKYSNSFYKIIDIPSVKVHFESDNSYSIS
ncbi:MAG: MXAN_6640 family putative metalloprotease, partial [Candidatus Marinimicrobia bacterium]|nr:MXAN_6640 family putative metalloprotease [Candidatus Neomarinimicrobiota bacterium]